MTSKAQANKQINKQKPKQNKTKSRNKEKGNWNTSEHIIHRKEEKICKSYDVYG